MKVWAEAVRPRGESYCSTVQGVPVETDKGLQDLGEQLIGVFGRGCYIIVQGVLGAKGTVVPLPPGIPYMYRA